MISGNRWVHVIHIVLQWRISLLPFSNSDHWNIKEMATRRHNFVLASLFE